MEGSSDSSEALLETLISRGWRLRDPAEVRSLIRSKMASGDGNPEAPASVGSVESELLGMDLRLFGGKSLPDPSALRKSSHLQGPKILQVVSVRDIYLSSIDSSFKKSHRQRRLLRFILTDGLLEVVAIEYSPIPSISEEIAPGTKVRLENKILIHNGILCLNSKVVTILGGLVQSLYEEWQTSQKYSGFSRSTFRSSQNIDDVGPPPFEKLRLEECTHQFSHQRSLHDDPPQPTAKVPKHTDSDARNGGKIQEGQFDDSKADKVDSDKKMSSLSRRIEDKPSSSDSRPKEVIEAVPVQNQAAAQKLLLKMNQPSHEGRPIRGPKYRKDLEEEAAVFTLDEWERRKASNVKPIRAEEVQDISHDEELARQLQHQLDLEDGYVMTGHGTEAEQIRMNMFSFRRGEEISDDRREFGGRGRGRGRARGRRGRGRGRFG